MQAVVKIVMRTVRISGLILLILLMLFVALNVIGLAFKNERRLSPWGTGFILIISGSMEPSIPVGALVFVREVSADKIEVGDVITSFSSDGQALVTHRVRRIITDGDEYMYITRGDANNTDDEPKSFNRVIGRVEYTVPGVNYLITSINNIRLLGIIIIAGGVIIFIFGFFCRKK